MSPAVHPAPTLTVRTVAIGDPGPLLDLLPTEAPLSWVREGEGMVGWGEAARVDVTGPARFAEAGAWWARLCAGATVADAVQQPGTGLMAFGTFEFAATPWMPDGADGTNRPSSLIVPAVAVGRRGDSWWLTTATARDEAGAEPGRPLAARDVSAEAAHDRAMLAQAQGGWSLPAPAAPDGLEWADAACTGGQWKDAVAEALVLIAGGDVQKVVLARDRAACAAAPLDPRWALRRLGALYPTCWTFAVDGFLGATPELLVRLQDGAVHSRVLAGTIRRPDPGASTEPLAEALRRSSKDRREHEFSIRSLVEALRPHCAALEAPEAPFVLTLPNVLHLASDVSGTAADGSTSLDLAAAVHPTAAVCGVPRTAAAHAIEALEPMSRARYAGPIGWLSASGDGEWGVALRCGQIDSLDPRRIRIFAGAGIVAQSEPESELAETDAKFAPMVSAWGS
ncbi:MAG: isochorismate synthase [Pseudonocardiales bacterium]|nr:isochorismate synthase [Pseudonocardiales bacterium]